MKCPACGKNTFAVYKCDNCGDVRCGAASCPGTMGGKGAASTNGTCKACKKGKYKKIS